MLRKLKLPDQKKITTEEALSYVLNQAMSKSKYIEMKRTLMEHGHDIYPGYEKVSCIILFILITILFTAFSVLQLKYFYLLVNVDSLHASFHIIYVIYSNNIFLFSYALFKITNIPQD